MKQSRGGTGLKVISGFRLPVFKGAYGLSLARAPLLLLLLLMGGILAPMVSADEPLPDPGNLRKFRKMQDEVLLFDVTGTDDGAVWGTGIYSDDSPLNLAVVHAGFVEPGQRAIVSVKILPGQTHYEASEQNGIRSRQEGKTSGSYQILSAEVLTPPTGPQEVLPVESTGSGQTAPSDAALSVPAEAPQLVQDSPSAKSSGDSESASRTQASSAEAPVVPAEETSGTIAAATTKTSDLPAMEKPASDGIGFGDVLEFLIGITYLIGVVVLLPLVIYTNINERKIPDGMSEGVADGETNADDIKADELLDTAMENLSDTELEDGSAAKTVTTGRQAKMLRETLLEIAATLKPINQAVIARFNSMRELYLVRSSRVFTGSYILIGCAILILIVYFWSSQGHITRFLVFHILGMTFYILASRTPRYLLEQRAKRSSGMSMWSIIFAGVLHADANTEYYRVYSDGRREIDHSQHATNFVLRIIFTIVLAMVFGMLIGFIGVFTFIRNYGSSVLIPFLGGKETPAVEAEA